MFGINPKKMKAAIEEYEKQAQACTDLESRIKALEQLIKNLKESFD